MRTSDWIRPLRLAAAVVLALAGLYLASVGVSLRISPQSDEIASAEGYAFHFAAPDAIWPLSVATDSEGNEASGSMLLEDGQAVGPAHAPHDDIRRLGRGRFSHWRHVVYFASRDNSDPRTNGRVYVLESQARLIPLAAAVLLAPLFLLTLMRLRRVRFDPRRLLASAARINVEKSATRWFALASYGAAVLLAMVAVGLVIIGKPANTQLAPAGIAADQGFAYYVALPQIAWPFKSQADSAQAGAASSTVVRENGRRLGPAHQPHGDIRQFGAGGYSQWEQGLYFSTSDNSDPRTNGRAYVVERMATLSRLVGLLALSPLALFVVATRKRHLAGLRAAAAWGERVVASGDVRKLSGRVGFGVAAALGALALYLGVIGVPANVAVQPARVAFNEGYAYTVSLPAAERFFSIPTDSATPSGAQSTAVLLENGRALGPSHSPHDDIRKLGAGRFSNWEQSIFFSASDNSDPRSNGRSYVVKRHAHLDLVLVLLGLAPLAALMFRGWQSPHTNVRKFGDLIGAPALKIVGDDRAFWGVCAVFIVVGAAFRIFWTITLQIPFYTDDTPSYFYAAMEHPLYPFGEQRTPGFPAVIAAAAFVFRNPIGILIFANCFWLLSAAALTAALAQWRSIRPLALAMLVYLCFDPKNMTFEYFAMSEHYSRVCFTAYLAAIVFAAGDPASWRRAALVGAVTAINLLVKPTALICFVSTGMFYAWFVWRNLGARRGVVQAAALATILPVLTLVLHSAAFDARYGHFRLTNFSGTNMFSHAGFLIDYDSPKNAELKAQLRPVMDQYVRDYVSQKRYEPNWMIYGSMSEQMRRDFNGASPKDILFYYLASHGVEPVTFTMDQKFGELVNEGVKAHFKEYVAFAIDRAVFFAREGYTFAYSGTKYRLTPSVQDLADRDLLKQKLRATLYFKSPQQGCGEHKTSPPPYPVARQLLTGALAPCAKDVPETARRGAVFVDSAWLVITSALRPLFDLLPKAAWIFPLVLVFAAARTRAAMAAFGICLFCVVVTFGYVALHGLINTAEPPRLFAPIQDAAVLTLLSAVLTGIYGLSSIAKAPVSERWRVRRAGAAHLARSRRG